MSRRKTERLLSLVLCLLSARRYLTAAQIREAVPGYPESFDAFKRMFERDKDELRELGIPLETGTRAVTRRTATGSRGKLTSCLRSRLEPDEAAVLGLAARVWRRAELAGAAEGALLKLRAAGIDAEDLTQPGIEPRVQTPRGRLRAAVGGRTGPASSHASATGARAAARRSARRLEPWGVVNRRGRWYVVGQDTDRQAERVFRLSRIDGVVTFTGPPGRSPCRRAQTFAPRCGTGIARPRPRALPAARAIGGRLRPAAARRSVEPDDEPGWDVVELTFTDTGWWSEQLASFGADVVVLEPTDLRDAVIGRLKGVLA